MPSFHHHHRQHNHHSRQSSSVAQDDLEGGSSGRGTQTHSAILNAAQALGSIASPAAASASISPTNNFNEKNDQHLGFPVHNAQNRPAEQMSLSDSNHHHHNNTTFDDRAGPQLPPAQHLADSRQHHLQQQQHPPVLQSSNPFHRQQQQQQQQVQTSFPPTNPFHSYSSTPSTSYNSPAFDYSTSASASQQALASSGTMYNATGPPAPGTNSVPGSLQPGGAAAASGQQPGGRPAAQSAYTAPAVPHINTNAQQYTLPTRSNTITQSQPNHSYSRSSPAGLQDQKYIPFSSAGGGPLPAADPATIPKYPQTPQQKFFSPTSLTGAPANSPLMLEQIRPRANSSLNDENSTLYGDALTATNSNYVAPWPVFAFDWCKYPILGGNTAGKMAIGSYLEDPHNFIQIIDTHITPQENGPGYGIEYSRVAEATCSYPVTRILWEPPISSKTSTDLLATSGDHLRLWSLPNSSATPVSSTITRSSSVNTRDQPPQKLTPLALLSNSKTPEHTAPLTSLDWNTLSPKLIITSSIDTTCTIWDIPTLTAKTQLIAHDKEVFDVRFCAGSVDVFVSCGADGSVRMFDLRSLEHSTIIYEPSEKQAQDARTDGTPPTQSSPTRANQHLPPSAPLLRLAASPHDSHLLATFASDSSITRILDVRQPGQALLELRGHAAAVNAVEWSGSRRGMLATGADDGLVLVWDLLNANNGASLDGWQGEIGTVGGQGPHGQVGAKGPAMWWRCDFEVGNLSWAPQSGLTSQGGEWLGVSGGRGVWGVKL